MSKRDPGPVPNRWLKCPRKATGVIAEKFLAFKTPLGPQFNEKVPEGDRFTPAMLFMYIRNMKMKIGLWIDLTNTSRFYDKSEVEKMDCKYVKMSCRGHGETPSPEQTRDFIEIVSSFITERPTEIIGVHCTHGFNRTGFLLTSYLVEALDWSLEAALNEFCKKREPGIYKDDYLKELFRRYDDVDYTPEAPPRPAWCREDDEDEFEQFDDEGAGFSQTSTQDNAPQHSNSNTKKKGKKETTHKKESFMPEVSGVEPFNAQPRLLQVQQKAQGYCKWEKTGFPGSQPVSMDRNNIQLLSKKPYRVSWKADGVRYLMLIDGEDEVYMLDRDNCAFKVHNLKFIHNTKDRHIRDTLIDGEMVLDRQADGADKPRFLCYDIIRFENMNVGKEAYPVRLSCIDKEIIKPRNRAIVSGAIKKELEPFSVALKHFWDVSMARQLLQDKFARTLAHEPDGLIFQPADDPYVAGACDSVLKWKPPCMNSVDFRLKIVRENRPGMIPGRVGQLFVGQRTDPFATIAVSTRLRDLDNRIIECKFDRNKWVFMRERTDKSYPNSCSTAMAVCKSIQEPVDKEYLLNYIEHYRFQAESKPHSPKRPRH